MRIRTRGFEVISKYKDKDIKIPSRATENSAGYDICAAEDVVFEPNEIKLVPTGLKAYMCEDEFLGVHVRSSVAIKKHLLLVNNIGIIDADYYNNVDNEGHIMIALMNINMKPVVVKKGERIAQGIFYEYKKTGNDWLQEKKKRNGGIGSTN